MSVFSNYSAYYDLLYKDKDYVAEVEYVTQLIRKHQSSAISILELGCGTGIHADLFTRKGFTVHGIDLSEAMLDIARDKFENNPKLSFELGDGRSYRNAQKYDVVVSLFHVFSYQTTNEDLLKAFETAKYHLKEGGLLLFDCWYGPGVITDKPTNRIKEVENQKMKISRRTTPTLFPEENCVNVHFDVQVTEKEGGGVYHLHEDHKMRYLFSAEIALFAALSGFIVNDSFEWLTLQTPNFNSWNAVFVLVKNY